jgi:hypothetical protein
MIHTPTRRGLITTGLISLVAAPAIVRAASLMPISVQQPVWEPSIVFLHDGRWLTEQEFERLWGAPEAAARLRLYRRLELALEPEARDARG